MRYWVAIFVVLFAMTLAWVPYVKALEISSEVGFSTARMEAINQQIQVYAYDHHELISGIHSALSLKLGTTFRFSILGIKPCIYGYGLFASSKSGGGPIKTTALGLAAGGRYTIGPWNVITDLGIYRGAFSFLRAGYDGLSGWGLGINGTLEYKFRLTTRISVAMSLTLRWLTIGQMSDRFGTPYVDRGGPFFDFSGVGAGVSFNWIAW